MDKNQYAAKLAAEMKSAGLSFTRSDAELFVDALAEAMKEGLAHDRKLTLSNFGTFIVSRFGAKIINSPRGDNKKFFMPPTDVIKWRPSMKVRDRAPSSKVSDEIYQKLIKGEIVEELPPEANIELPKAKKLGQYEIVIDFKKRVDLSHLSDEQSPISRLIKRLISDFIRSGSNKLEIRPGKTRMLFIYYLNDVASSVKYLPNTSHQIIIDKFKFMAKNSSGSESIKIGDNGEIKLSSLLTPHGESLFLKRI
jgi:nucleoid DNA-binding protein